MLYLLRVVATSVIDYIYCEVPFVIFSRDRVVIYSFDGYLLLYDGIPFEFVIITRL
jgi:hypothetical protein